MTGAAGEIAAQAEASAGAGAASARPGLDRVLPAVPVLAALAATFLAIKTAAYLFAGAWPDEGYYWLYGQHPALSYYDHPPLGGWVNTAISAVFGDGLLQARLATLPTFAGVAWLIWYWAGRLAAPETRMRAFLGGLVVWQATPLFAYFHWLALLDHYLIFLGMLSVHFFALHVERRDAGRPATAMLYASAIALGLAALAKYNAAFIAAGYLVYALSRRDRMAWLKSPHSWLSALLVLAMLGPVFWWNHAHDWPSFRYYLDERLDRSHLPPAKGMFIFAAYTVIEMTPVMLVLAARAVAGAFRAPLAAGLQGPGAFCLMAGFAVWLSLAPANIIAPVWNMTSFLFIVPIAAFFLRSRLEFVLHALFGLAVSAAYLHQAVFGPFNPEGTALGTRTPAIVIAAGELADLAQDWESRLGAEMVVTTDYLTAAQISLKTGRTDIQHIGMRRDMWDFWFRPADHGGKDAVVIADRNFPVDAVIENVFETVTPVATHEVVRSGKTLHVFTVYHAENYAGEGPR